MTWFAYEDKHTWISLPLEKLNEYLKLNAKGEKAPELILEILEPKVNEQNLQTFAAVDLANEDINRMDNKRRTQGNNRPNNNRPNNNRPNNNNLGGGNSSNKNNKEFKKS